MQGQRSYISFHVPGTLAANLNIRWQVAKTCYVKELSGVASNDSDATIALGISSDTDSILAAATTGDSGTPVVKTQSNFATTNATGKLVEGEIAVITVDYDGATGTAAADLTIVITLLDAG